MLSNRTLLMKNNLLLISYLCLPALFSGCSSSDSPFSENGGAGSSSTNIITGINFSLGADEPNPAVVDDTGSHGGVEVTLTVRAGDRNNAAVTTGTVYFRSEYGLLNPNFCVINSTGTCSVTWTSILSNIPADLLADITAYTLGEDSYLDLDDSGNFNDGDTPLTDFPEPYVNVNHVPPAARVFDVGFDIPIDLDNSGDTGAAHTPADGLLSVSGCTHSSLCAPTSLTYIFAQLTLDLDKTTPP